MQFADLSWTPASPADTVELKRDGNVIATVSDTGAYTDNIGSRKLKGSYVYQVCVVQTGECSNQVTVKFPRGR